MQSAIIAGRLRAPTKWRLALGRFVRLLQIIGNDMPGAGRRTRRWFQACLVTRDGRRDAGLILRPSRRKCTYNRIEIRSAPVRTHAVRKCGAHAIPPWTIDDFSRVLCIAAAIYGITSFIARRSRERPRALKFTPRYNRKNWAAVLSATNIKSGFTRKLNSRPFNGLTLSFREDNFVLRVEEDAPTDASNAPFTGYPM